MVTHTVSIPEIVWSFIAFLGVLFNGRITWRALQDLLSLRARRINHIREYAAITTVVLFLDATIVQVGFLAVGVVQMTTPGTHVNGGIPPQQYVTAGIIVAMELLLAAGAAIVERRRVKLVKKIRDIEEGI